MFSIDEKSAIVQCFWQLLSAKPTQEERDFVDKLTSTWGLSGSWVYVAIQQEPYVAFKKVKEYFAGTCTYDEVAKLFTYPADKVGCPGGWSGGKYSG